MAEKKYIYATAANGMTVRVPADRFEEWKQAQEKIRTGQPVDTKETQEQLLRLLLGDK